MKRIIFLLIGIFIFACGCNDDILPVDSALGNENLKKTEIKMVPITGKVFVRITEYDEQGFGIGASLAGFFTHFGKLNETKSWSECISHDFSQLPIISYVHYIECCTANGDLVYGTYAGTIDVRTLEANATWIFEGGTGRFENVSGQMIVHGYAERDETGKTIGSYLEGEGEISNVGSSK